MTCRRRSLYGFVFLALAIWMATGCGEGGPSSYIVIGPPPGTMFLTGYNGIVVANNDNLFLTFSDNVNPASLVGATTVFGSGNTLQGVTPGPMAVIDITIPANPMVVPGTIHLSDNRLSFSPTSSLPYEHTYKIVASRTLTGITGKMIDSNPIPMITSTTLAPSTVPTAWTKVTVSSRPISTFTSYATTVDLAGNSYIAWGQTPVGAIYLRKYGVGTIDFTTYTLQDNSVGNQMVNVEMIAGNDNAITVTWVERPASGSDIIRAARLKNGSVTPMPPITVTHTGRTNLSVDKNGNVSMLFSVGEYPGGIVYRYTTCLVATGTWSSPVTVKDASPDDQASVPQVQGDANGTLIVSWLDSTGAKARIVKAGGTTLSPILVLSSGYGQDNTLFASVSMNSAGFGLVTWLQSSADAKFHVQGRIFNLSNSAPNFVDFQPLVDLTPVVSRDVSISKTGATEDGKAFVSWYEYGSTALNSRYSTGGDFSLPQIIGTVSGDTLGWDSSLSTYGRGSVFCSYKNSMNQIRFSVFLSDSMSPSWGTSDVVLEGMGANETVRSIRASANPFGRLVVGWEEYNHVVFPLQESLYMYIYK